MRGKLLSRFAASALLVVLAGCTPSQPTRYFALTPMSDEMPIAETDKAIGVFPIVLANYLDRNGIVMRTSPNELTVAGTDNWIEPLDLQIRGIVARNLAQLLGTERVFVLPEQRLLPFDHTVEIAVDRFDIEVGAVPGEGEAAAEVVVLEGRWALFEGESRDVLETAPVRITEAVSSPADFERRAAAMSEAATRLSRIIAGAIAVQDN
jgi:uncharacterized lipoprotein YmbA